MSAAPEISLLSYIVQNPDEYPSLEPIFQETNFQFKNQVVEFIHQLIQDSWQRFETVPTQSQMKSWLDTKQVLRSSPDKGRVLLKVVDRIYEEELDGLDRQVVLGCVLEAERATLAERIAEMDPHTYPEICSWVQSRLDVLTAISRNEAGQWAMPLDDRWITQPEQTLKTYLGNPIPLGWPRTDFWLGGGGRRGELIMPAALPEDGKTMMLVTLACNMIRQGFRVYIAQCDNTFEEFIAKIWANLAGCSTDDLVNPDNQTQYKLMQVRKRYPNIHRQLVIRKWPRGSKTVADFRRDMLQFEKMLRPYDLARGVHEKSAGLFDAVMGDYIDTFTARRSYREHRFGLDEVTKEFAGLCEEFEKLGIFPTQLNRTAKYIEVPDIDNLSEAFTKSHHAAVIPMLFGTKAQRLLGRMSIFWAKTRRLRNKFVTSYVRDNRTQTFIEDEAEPYYLDAGPRQDPNSPESKKKRIQKPKPEPTSEEDPEVQALAKKVIRAVAAGKEEKK